MPLTALVIDMTNQYQINKNILFIIICFETQDKIRKTNSSKFFSQFIIKLRFFDNLKV